LVDDWILKLKSREVIVYIVVGALTTIVNFSVYTMLYYFLKIDITISNIISVIVSILFAYVMNKIFVFHSHCESLQELFGECTKFISARIITMIIEVGGVFLLVNIIGQDEFIGKLETQIIVLIGNYLISKFFVFK